MQYCWYRLNNHFWCFFLHCSRQVYLYKSYFEMGSVLSAHGRNCRKSWNALTALNKWKFTHPQTIQNVDEFVSSSDLEKCVTASVSQQWKWMGAARMRVQTADKNITIIHKRKHYYGLWTRILVINVLMLDLSQLLSSPDVNWWTGVVWIIVMFLSAVWTLILTAPIHCRASIAETLMQRHISTNLMKKQTHLDCITVTQLCKQ